MSPRVKTPESSTLTSSRIKLISKCSMNYFFNSYLGDNQARASRFLHGDPLMVTREYTVDFRGKFVHVVGSLKKRKNHLFEVQILALL